MAHDFLVKDIAWQAGLSTATVDRVLNGRGGVRRQTAARVAAAIEELRGQEHAALSVGRRMVIDVVMEAPDRFTAPVRAALESEAATFLPTVFRVRFHVAEQVREADLVRLMDRIRTRGSDGLVLKAPDRPAISEAVDRLEAAGIPVITLVTDLSRSRRTAYAGADNRAAGETAAYLIGERMAEGAVLVTLSSSRFRGEEERELGFRRLIAERYPALGIVEVSEGYGRDDATYGLVAEALSRHSAISAVYSIGGGNRAVIKAFDDLGRSCRCFVAHDLDADNLALLRARRLSYVLHHDLAGDARNVYRALIRAGGTGRPQAEASLSALAIITPYNIPAGRG